MAIVLVGLNHRTAPVALREQLFLNGCSLDIVLSELKVSQEAQSDGHGPIAGIHESVLLSTCNRLEVYAVGEATVAFGALEDFLARLQGMPLEQLHPHLYLLEAQAAVEHLLRVASGLDSLILGESQILGQVAHAQARAQSAGTIGPVLSQLFTRAIHTGKRARSETAISRYPTSVGHAAARLAKSVFGDLSQARVLIVGAGEIAELAAMAIYSEGAQRIACINRTYLHAEHLARRFGGQALHWGRLADALVEADVIITATGAPHTVIYRDDVLQVLPRRNRTPLVIVDIAVPRDVELDVGELPGVLLYDIDHLQNTVDANRSLREAAVPQVEAIVRQELEDFFCWLRARQVTPLIVELRRKAEKVAQDELELALRRLNDPDPRVRQVMTLLAHRIVSKLFHEPTVRLKAEAANGNGIVYADALRELFALDHSSDMGWRGDDYDT